MLGLFQIGPGALTFWERTYLGNTYERWAIAVGVLVVSFLALGVVKRVIHAHLKRLALKTETDIDDLLVDLVGRTRRFFLFVIALWLAHHTIDWSVASVSADQRHSKVESVVEAVLLIGCCIQAGLWGLGLVAYGISRLIHGKSADDPARTMGVTVLSFLGHTVVWSVVVLSCLQALGAPVGTLIASLGVGGIAVALALQNVLGDLFASIAILLDKPFIVGDGIQVGEFVGSVERIGVKTTRLRSVNGEEIVMGNNDLVSSRIRNYKRLEERRIVLVVGVEYDTPITTVERIPQILKEIIETTPNTRFDRAHFRGFGASSLDFEAVYFSALPDYVALMNVQQSVNLNVLKRFAEEGISFAFPTQTVRHVMKDGEVVPPGLDVREQSLAAHQMAKQLKKPN